MLRQNVPCIPGCHDNGYITNLRSQITAGFKEKLILLRSYVELAAGMADLDLPVLTIPDLFLTQKLGLPHTAQIISGAPPGLGLFQSTAPVAAPLVLSRDGEAPRAIPELTIECDIFTARRPSSYSSVVRSTQKRAPTPELDSNSSSASDTSDEVLDHHHAPTFKPRHINPKIVS